MNLNYLTDKYSYYLVFIFKIFIHIYIFADKYNFF